MEISLLIGKILFGGYFIYSGLNHFRSTEMLAGYAKSKNVPMPKASVLLSGAMMVLGGLGVLLGMYVKISLALIAAFLLVASFAMHAFWKESDQAAKMGDMVNFTKNIALIGAILMLIALL